MTIFSINCQLYTYLTEKASTLGPLNTGKVSHSIMNARDVVTDLRT